METIIAAFISAGVTLIVCLITQGVSNSRNRAVMEYQIGQLTKQVEKHNQVLERMTELETKVALNAEKNKSLQYQINDMQRGQSCRKQIST